MKFHTVKDKTYPQIAGDYARTFADLKNLSFDIWLTPHASQFGLHDKHRPGEAYNPQAFIDHKGYKKALQRLEQAYNDNIGR